MKKKSAKRKPVKKAPVPPSLPPTPSPVLSSLPREVRLAGWLAFELESCELGPHEVGIASCLAAVRYFARPCTVDHLMSVVLGHLLIEGARPLSELRVLLVEGAVLRAYERWRKEA